MLHLKSNNVIYVFDCETVTISFSELCVFRTENHYLESLFENNYFESAHIWWQLWGGSTCALQYVGMRVTAQIKPLPRASATEELWSEYDFVVNQSRTSLLKGRADQLVRVHANARIAHRMRGLDYSGRELHFSIGRGSQ